MNRDTFIQQLLTDIPEFRPIYEEHMADNDELLPHVLMGAFTRFFYDAYLKSTSVAENQQHWEEVVRKSLDLMESAISTGDRHVENLIWVSFVENLLPYSDSGKEDVEAYNSIKPLLGPKLSHALRHFDPGA